MRLTGRKTAWTALLAAGMTCGCAAHSDTSREPSPALSPSEVVRIQVVALQHYNEPRPNAGIWTAFQFASPANRQLTGPYGHFLQVIKSPANRPFLRAQKVRYYPLRQTAWQAEQIVELTDDAGKTTRWVFALSKQREGVYLNCWMTDSVYQDGAKS